VEKRIPQTTRASDLDQRPVVCPHCMASNRSRRHFCHSCGTPLTDLAVTDPIGQIYSESDTYRKAADNANRPIVLIGMWLILGPIFLSCVAMAIVMTVEWIKGPVGPIDVMTVFAIVVGIGMIGGMGTISGILLFRTTRSFIRLRNERGPE
jgi:hypothetical protein